MCFHMEHSLVIYSDLGHEHALDSVPESDYLTDNLISAQKVQF